MNERRIRVIMPLWWVRVGWFRGRGRGGMGCRGKEGGMGEDGENERELGGGEKVGKFWGYLHIILYEGFWWRFDRGA